MLPPRCFTCNNAIGHLWKPFTEGKTQQHNYKELLDNLGLPRICCRRMMLTHVEVVDDIAMYSNKNFTMDESKTTFNSLVENERIVKCD